MELIPITIVGMVIIALVTWILSKVSADVFLAFAFLFLWISLGMLVGVLAFELLGITNIIPTI